MAPKIHMKGRLLQILAEGGEHWDYEIATQLLREYEMENSAYWHDQIRLELADLQSSGLIAVNEAQDTIDPDKTFGREKLVRLYSLTPFGRERMRETELLPRAAAQTQEV
jgi:hypothetical protein